jgi:hypothetical protein
MSAFTPVVRRPCAKGRRSDDTGSAQQEPSPGRCRALSCAKRAAGLAVSRDRERFKIVADGYPLRLVGGLEQRGKNTQQITSQADSTNPLTHQ